MTMKTDFDYIVIGSGFGGSVSACRLAEKGYRVAVIEMGRRYRAEDFPRTNWNLRRYFWAPLVRFFGFFRMTLFRHAFVISGVGVGGGSLVYANTLLVPPDPVWDDPRWAGLDDWARIMPEYYDLASRNLGVVENPYMGTADRMLKDAAKAYGVEDTHYPTRVAVYFGEPGVTAPDPYFDGRGPARTGCVLCGGCMVGCRHGAKNTLDRNYLYFAEQAGAQIIPEHRVVDVRPIGAADGSQGYRVTARRSTGWLGRREAWTTKGVVFSAGVLGTVRLLMDLKQRQSLPNLSDRLGDFVRTNSESIIGVRLDDPDVDVTDGIAIGSGIHIDHETHIEAVRYPRGSDAMGATATIMTDGRPGPTRILSWLVQVVRHPIRFLRAANPVGFARSTIILLVMQTVDTHIKMRLVRRKLWPFGRKLQTSGPPIPTFIPAANDFARTMARTLGGTPSTAVTEIFANVPTTAHILGGAPMGQDRENGVIDSCNQMFGYENMFVCDGSMIGANLGVNPSLTITALTERAMSLIPPAQDVA